MQLPLLYGTGASEAAEFIQVVPLNLEPLFFDSKISKGQLRSTTGAVTIGTGPGTDRGGINWNGICYRVMGTKLVQVAANGTVTILGDVGGTGPCSFDYGFDRLGIRSGSSLYYWDGMTLVQVTDVDLGAVVDMLWIDGYFMATDGTSVVVTELSDPTSVLPLKYGSAENDPDSITGLLKLREEAYFLGQYTIQVVQNVGGNGFPFAPVPGSTIPYGCVGPMAKCLFAASFAFVGQAKNEALAVFQAGQGTATKISSRALDDALAKVSDPSAITVEKRVSRDEARLIVHLPDESWMFLLHATEKVEEPIWIRLQSGNGDPYRIRNAVNVYGKTLAGDLGTAAIGALSEDVSTHFGAAAQWQFDAGLIYGSGSAGILHTVELVGLPGRGSGTIFLSLTRDGETFSTERAVAFMQGERTKRMQWRPHTRFSQRMGLRFRGYDDAVVGFAAIEANVIGLNA